MKTPDYWIEREKAWQSQQIKDDTKRMKQIMDKLFEAQEAIQKECDTLQNLDQIQELCVLVLAMALYLARSLGADTKQLANHWINTAIQNGAKR